MLHNESVQPEPYVTMSVETSSGSSCDLDLMILALSPYVKSIWGNRYVGETVLSEMSFILQTLAIFFFFIIIFLFTSKTYNLKMLLKVGKMFEDRYFLSPHQESSPHAVIFLYISHSILPGIWLILSHTSQLQALGAWHSPLASLTLNVPARSWALECFPRTT